MNKVKISLKNTKIYYLVVFAACLFFSLSGFSQSPSHIVGQENKQVTGQDESPPESDATATPAPSNKSGDFLSSKELTGAYIVGVVSLIAMALQFCLLLKVKNHHADDALRPFAVTLIITGTLFLIVTGYSAQNIAPAMGLFGTVAGYLIGRRSEKKNIEEFKKDEQAK